MYAGPDVGVTLKDTTYGHELWAWVMGVASSAATISKRNIVYIILIVIIFGYFLDI
jgi:4-amino-4-deoxy-L-arabinose transferase-like glycosyltransferase